MKISKTKLDNGLRLVVVEMPDVRSVATMCFVRAGSRNETREINGISHFLEHMVFKATEKFKNQLEVARAIEGIGGQLNAWTDQDHTNYYNIVPSEYSKVGMEVVSELVLNPKLKKEDLERERGVIIEEMNRRWDAPEDYVWELAIEQIWPDQALGMPVIGQKEVIEKVTIDTFKEYRKKWYTSDNMVLVVAGKTTFDDSKKLTKKYFGNITKQDNKFSPETAKDGQLDAMAKIFSRKTDQSHLVLGIKTFDRYNEDKYILNVLNTILGIGMSSRLFMEIREKRGLCYSIHSSTEHYSDTGGFFIHSGLNTKLLHEAIKAICEQLQKLKQKPIPDDELDEAKRLIAGSIEMSADSSSAQAIMFGKQALEYDKILSLDDLIKKHKAVSAKQIQDLAKKIFLPEKTNLTIIGPLSDKKSEEFKKLLVF